jgi:3-carboxy-cis,cis-muconate cycloisomerase
VLRITGWLTRMTTALAKMGEDLILMTQSGIGEVRLGHAGGSSTMPQKQNPVGPSALVGLSHHVTALNGAMLAAGHPRQERDGAAWFTEWLSLPQLVLSAASALETARDLAPGLAPDAEAMRAALSGSGGLIHAEALSFRLTALMPRPEAQAQVKQACLRARDEGRHLTEIAAETWPEIDTAEIFDARAALGTAPDEARLFARRARRAA